MRTEAELKAALQGIDNMAKRAMRQCLHPLIDTALREGWSRSLQDIFRDCLRQHWERQGRLPSMEWLEGVRVGPIDIAYYRKAGHAHVAQDVADIKSARASLPRRTSRKDQAAGEVA